jgi:ribosomal protein S8
LRGIVWLVKGSVNYIITIEKIISFKKKYGYSTGFVLTRKGVLDFQECIKQNATGILLVILK